MGLGEFADGKDQARLVADSPALLVVHDGESRVEYVRMDVYAAAASAMEAAWDLGKPGARADAREDVAAKLNRARSLMMSVTSEGATLSND